MGHASDGGGSGVGAPVACEDVGGIGVGSGGNALHSGGEKVIADTRCDGDGISQKDIPDKIGIVAIELDAGVGAEDVNDGEIPGGKTTGVCGNGK